MLAKFYFLVNLGEGCMTELRINFTVFALASFLISQRLWVTEPATHSTWAADVTFVPGLY